MLDSIGDFLGGVFEAISRSVLWIASKLFGLAQPETTPVWARIVAAVVIFGAAALITVMLWTYIIAVAVAIVVIGAIAAFFAS
jgi:hypothetical protein